MVHIHTCRQNNQTHKNKTLKKNLTTVNSIPTLVTGFPCVPQLLLARVVNQHIVQLLYTTYKHVVAGQAFNTGTQAFL